jgi:hypothetical protein
MLFERENSSTRFLGPSLLVNNPEFHPLGNLAQRRLQRVGNLPQPAYRRIYDPSLDPADVCSVEAALAAKALLRVAGPLTEFSHDGPDGSHFQIGRLDLPLAPLHQQIRWCYFEAYQPTAYTPHLKSAAGDLSPSTRLGMEWHQIRSDVVSLRTEWTNCLSPQRTAAVAEPESAFVPTF